MSTNSERSQTPAARRFLLVLLALAVFLIAYIVAPFAGALFTAAVLATVLAKTQSKLAARLGDRNVLSATVLTVGTSLLALLPFATLAFFGVREILVITSTVQEAFEKRGVEGVIDAMPESIRTHARSAWQSLPEDWRADATAAPAQILGAPEESPKQESNPEQEAESENSGSLEGVGTGIGTAARVVGGLLQMLSWWAVQIGMVVVLLFFLLSDGPALIEWIRRTCPLGTEQTDEFLSNFRDVTIAVFASSFFSAIVQTVLAVIAFLIAGTSGLALWVFLTFFAAFLPAIGGGPVVFLAGILQLAAGETWQGILLMIWAVLVVGSADNFARPWFAQGRLGLPGSIVFLSMIGGLLSLGALGVIAGPLITSFFLVVVKALERQGANKQLIL